MQDLVNFPAAKGLSHRYVYFIFKRKSYQADKEMDGSRHYHDFLSLSLPFGEVADNLSALLIFRVRIKSIIAQGNKIILPILFSNRCSFMAGSEVSQPS